MLIITTIVQPNELTQRTVNSFTRLGYEVADSMGIGQRTYDTLKRFKSVYELLLRASTGHDIACYTDAADTICQRPFELPEDQVTYSAEKAMWPAEGVIEGLYDDYPKFDKIKQSYKDKNGKKRTKSIESRWRYLNGGGWGGPIPLLIEFFEKYLNPELKEAYNNGQIPQHRALKNAIADGFPIKLDTKCDIFQCIGHMEEDEFSHGEKDELITNLITKSTPAIFHGNGQTPMDWIAEQVL